MYDSEQFNYHTSDLLVALRQWTFGREAGMVFQLKDGQIQGCNRAAQEMLGLTITQLVGCNSINRPCFTIHENDSRGLGEDNPAAITLRTGKPCLNVVMGLYKPSGELVWLLVDSQPLFLAQTSDPYAVVTTFFDITDCMMEHVDRETRQNYGHQPQQNLQGSNILVVDDDIDTLDILSVILKDAGANVMLAASVTEAFTALQGLQPDLIISDLGMPDIDGYDFIRELRNRPDLGGDSIPAIALTAYGYTDSDREIAISVGFQDYLIKPADPEQLLNIIKLYCKKKYIEFANAYCVTNFWYCSRITATPILRISAL